MFLEHFLPPCFSNFYTQICLTIIDTEGGPKGDKGDPGPKGEQGDTGAQGPKGDPGKDGTCSPNNCSSSGIIEKNSVKYSINATFIGFAKSSSGQKIAVGGKMTNGWKGMKEACETTYGDEAKLCTEQDIIRTLQLGIAILSSGESAWVAGAYSSTSVSGQQININNCGSWTNETSSVAGKTIKLDNNQTYLSYSLCSEKSHFIACCK